MQFDFGSDDGFGDLSNGVADGSNDLILTDRQQREFDIAIASAAFDAELRHSTRRFSLPGLTNGPSIRMPWESSVGSGLWSQRLADSFQVDRPLFAPTIPSVVPAQTSLSRAAKSLFPSIVRKLPLVSWPVQLNAKRHLALRKWRLVLEENFGATSLGLQLQEASLELVADEVLTSIIEDAFSPRPTSTLSKRVNPLLKFFIWVRRNFGVAASPVSESRAYAFVKDLINSKAAPTAPSAFVSALNFACFFVKMEGAGEAASSLRVKGAAHSHYLTKRMLKQSKLLLVLWVKMFEEGVFDCPDPEDRIACGFVASLVHCRGRFSEVQFSDQAFLDVDENGEGYLEYLSKDVKTSRTKESQKQFMPSVCPVQGVADRPWAIQWMKERKIQKIDRFSCMLPSLSASGEWIDHPADATVVTNWMKNILEKFGVCRTEMDGLTSHGAKATALSWCAKYNMSIETRQLLGHHVVSSQTTCLTYSRDAQAGPLREYDTMLADIRANLFLPDKSRSGRLVKRAKTGEPSTVAASDVQNANVFPVEACDPHVPLECQFDSVAEVPMTVAQHPSVRESDSDSDSGSSVESSDSSSSGSDADSAGTLALVKIKPKAPCENMPVTYFVCHTSQLLHVLEDEAGNKFRCSRTISKNFVRVSAQRAALHLGCAQCLPK